METDLIAPCGINCALCSGYQRKKNTCAGCNREGEKPGYCATCIIKHCPEKAENDRAFCVACGDFPCRRMKNLEKRYRTRYGVNLFENLNRIRAEGIDSFIRTERNKWACRTCGKPLCMHKAACLACGSPNPWYPVQGHRQ